MHTHTVFSDGRDPAEAVVGAALRLGFHTLGFTDHGYAAYDDAAMPADAIPRYCAEIQRLREKYAGQIHLRLGIERDFLSGLDLSPYEYAIESVHYIRSGGDLLAVDMSRKAFVEGIRTHFGGDPYAFCREYFRTVSASCSSEAPILGHMDLVMKFNEARDLFDDTDPRYLKPALEAADAAADSGKLVEINTGAMARGYRTQPYPGPAMLRRLAQRRVPVLITSDCHDSALLDCGFADCAELARACGFKAVLDARGDGFVEIPLEVVQHA